MNLRQTIEGLAARLSDLNNKIEALDDVKEALDELYLQLYNATNTIDEASRFLADLLKTWREEE